MWNTYGPTETTVVACAAQMRSDEPVRIGLPLDGWHLAVVDPETGVPVECGGVGELVIGGVGTARYLDREKDAAKFTPLLALDWDRAYRSGDLVRADPEGLSFIGRADTQVKIRGFRIELSEIEAVLLQMPGVGQAVVSTYESAPGLTELVAYYSPVPGSAVDAEGIRTTLRNRLPGHMVPGYVEELAEIPMMTSGKADRKALPPPRRRSGGASPEAYVAPANQVETVLAEALAEIVGLDKVSVESHFFDDLGANSLMLAHFCAKVRRAGGLPPVAMQDVYQNPTVRSLAAALPKGDAPAPVPVPEPAAVPPVGTLSYVFCGLMQLLVMIGLVALGAALFDIGLRWIWPATDPVQIFVRTSAFSTATLAAFVLLPVLAKWLLIGRWKPQEIRLWSLSYLRFWAVKTLIRTNPWVMFAGSPLYLMYLRALGAKIGKGVTIFSPTVPVCTDMLRIGSHTVIREWRVVQRLPRRRRGDPHRRHHDRRGRRRRRGRRADLGDVDGRRRPARARLVAAHAGSRSRRGSTGTARRPGPPTPTSAASTRPAAVASGGSSTAACSCSTCWCSRRPWPRPWSGCCRRSPTSPTSSGRARSPRCVAAFYLEQLALAAVVLFGGFLVGLLYVATVPRVVQPVPRDREGLPALRHPVLGAAVRRAHDQRVVLRQLLRRQLLHRRLPALDRVPRAAVGPDGLELRRHAHPRHALSVRDRRGHDALRRRRADERLVLQHLVQDRRDDDRGAQLPRQHDHLPGGRQDRGERPGRHQDHDPDRRGAAARHRPARLAVVRDPAVGEPPRPH